MSTITQDNSRGDSSRVTPTSLDVMRSIMRLDSVSDVGPGDTAVIDRQEWTYRQLIDSIGDQLAFVLNRHGVSTRKFSLRDARVLMAASGASAFTIDRHARAVAASARAHTDKRGRWSAS